MAWVNIPRNWRGVTATARLQVPGTTLGEVVGHLCSRYPALTGWLDNGLGALPGYLHLFIGDVDANVLGGMRAPVRDDVEIHVVIEMSGG
jgi:sulfur-carrier protein